MKKNRPIGVRASIALALILFLLTSPFTDHVRAAAGDLDLGFGNAGKVVTDFFGFADEVHAVVIQPDGKIVVAGRAGFADGGFDLGVARYEADGTPDPSFGSGGKAFGSVHLARVSGMALQPDGKIVVAGYSAVQGDTTKGDFGLARFDAGGTPDESFGTGGKVVTDFSGLKDGALALTIQPGGKIVAAGSAFDEGKGFDFPLVRYNADGSMDGSFGNGGKITTDFFGGFDAINAIALQGDDKVVAAGVAGSGESFLSNDFALARYDLGSFDLCLQDSGNGNILQVNTTTGEYQFTSCGGFTVGGTGTLTKKGGTYTLQHNASDRRVTAKIDTSANRGSATVQVFSTGIMFSITDRNIADSSCACN